MQHHDAARDGPATAEAIRGCATDVCVGEPPGSGLRHGELAPVACVRLRPSLHSPLLCSREAFNKYVDWLNAQHPATISRKPEVASHRCGGSGSGYRCM